MNDPEKVIVGALLATAGVLTWRGVTTGQLGGGDKPVAIARTYGALVVVAFVLLVLGQFVPELAAAFAGLVLVAVLLNPRAVETVGSLAKVGG